MDRRNFIRLAATGSAAGIIAPATVLANPALPSGAMAGGVYYTKEAPGRWDKKIVGHLPNIELSKGPQGTMVQVVTPHGMHGHGHYIVKHVVLDQDFNYLTEKVFDPNTDKKEVSEFALGQYSGQVNVLSVCNLHDTWLNVAEV